MSSNLLQKPDRGQDRRKGEEREGKEREGKERCNALHSQMATPAASFVQSSSY